MKQMRLYDIVPIGSNGFDIAVHFIDDDDEIYAWTPTKDEIENLSGILDEYTELQ